MKLNHLFESMDAAGNNWNKYGLAAIKNPNGKYFSVMGKDVTGGPFDTIEELKAHQEELLNGGDGQAKEGLTPQEKNNKMSDYDAKSKALQDIQSDPNTDKDPELKKELMRRKAELEKTKESVDSESITESEFNNGDQVVLKPPYAEDPNEVFTLQNWDGNRGFIADKDGRGWYVTGDQIRLSDDDLEEAKGDIRKALAGLSLAALMGYGIGQGLEATSAKHSPLGKAMSQAAQQGDDYAAKHLKNLDFYFDANDTGSIKILSKKYLGTQIESLVATNRQPMVAEKEDHSTEVKSHSSRIDRVLQQLRAKNPQARSDLEALLYDYKSLQHHDREMERDITQLYQQNSKEDAEIAKIEKDIENLKARRGIREADPDTLGKMNPSMRDLLSKVHSDDEAEVQAARDAEEAKKKEQQARLMAILKTGGKDVEEYIDRLKSHDWTYAYSDDHRAWQKGSDEWREIKRLQQELDPEYDVYNKYAPDMFKAKVDEGYEPIAPGVEHMAQRVHDDLKAGKKSKNLSVACATLVKYHGKDWRKRLNVKEEQQSVSEATADELDTALYQGGEQGLAKAMGMSHDELNELIDLVGFEQGLHADDDRQEILDYIVVDNADE